MRSDEVHLLRARVAGLLRAGATPGEVARQLACSRSTVYKVVRLLGSAASALADGRHANPGRPRLYADEVWARVLALRRWCPELGPRLLRQMLLAEAMEAGRVAGPLPAPATIADALRRTGLAHTRRAARATADWRERPARPGTLTLDTWGPWRLQGASLYLITVQDRFTRLALAYPLPCLPDEPADGLLRLLAEGWPRALALARRSLLPPGKPLDAVYAHELAGLAPVGGRLPPCARAVLAAGGRLTFTPPGRPWPNGRLDRFHGAMEREFWQREQPYGLSQALEGLRAWLDYYNRIRPHAALAYRAPADRAPWFRNLASLSETGPAGEVYPSPIVGDIIAVRLVSAEGAVALWQDEILHLAPALAGQYVRVRFRVTEGPGDGTVVASGKEGDVVVARFEHRLGA